METLPSKFRRLLQEQQETVVRACHPCIQNIVSYASFYSLNHIHASFWLCCTQNTSLFIPFSVQHIVFPTLQKILFTKCGLKKVALCDIFYYMYSMHMCLKERVGKRQRGGWVAGREQMRATAEIVSLPRYCIINYTALGRHYAVQKMSTLRNWCQDKSFKSCF